MELFKLRPLCACCGLFLLFSYISAKLMPADKIFLLIGVLAIFILLAIVGRIFRLEKYGFFSLLMCLLFIIGALVNNLLRVELPKTQAEKYLGERSAVMNVIEREHYSSYSSSYVVDVTEIDGEKTSVRALVVLGFGAEELSVGDALRADVEFYRPDASVMGQTGYQRTDREDVTLVAAVYESDSVAVRKFDRDMSFFGKLFSQKGVSVLIYELRSSVAARIDKCLGESIGALANAYLTGDKSDVEVSTVRDYRRSGISHLFAVSGMHVSILLGAIELLLKKLYCRKSLRCVILSVCALGLLCLTGFSMSAMRSVFMLFAVYIIFLLSEENDSPTSLFVAVSVIILITPYAIYELGMWMSFLATLAVITFYPLIERAIPRLSKKKAGRALRALYAIPRACLLTAGGTVAATMFLLPVSWAIFGEISLVAIPANIVMSPLATLFLILSALAALCCNIPLISYAIRYLAVGVSSLMTLLVENFSGLDIATVSLGYPFAKWLVIVFTAIVAVMMLIRISRKILFVLPPIAFAVSFLVCVICFGAVNPSAMSYHGQGTNELISVSNDESFAVIDMSDGRYSRFGDALDSASAYGTTEIESIVLTSVSSSHVSGLDYFLRSNTVRTLYLPEPYSDKSRELSAELITIAENCGTRVSIYNGDSAFEICDGIFVRAMCSQIGDKRSVAAFVSDGESVYGYVDAFFASTPSASEAAELISRCDTLIIGNNGVPDHQYSYDVSEGAKIVYAGTELKQKSNIHTNENNTYFNTKKVFDFRIVFD